MTFEGGDTIFSSYIPPLDSHFFSHSDFARVCNVMRTVDNSNVLVGGGDLNARIGDVTKEIPLRNYNYRPNPDYTVNSHGTEPMKRCESFNCYIVNNLSKGSLIFDGKLTFQKGDRAAQNDIILANRQGLRNLTEFIIFDDLNWNPSDHTPVTAKVTITISRNNIRKLASMDLFTTSGEPRHIRRKLIIVENVNWDTYNAIVSNDFQQLQQHLVHLNNNNNLNNMDTVIREIDKVFYNAALTAKVERRSLPITQDNDSSLQGDRLTVVNHIDKANQIKQSEMWRNILRSNDSKSSCSHINWNGKSEAIADTPDIDDLKNHFKQEGKSNEESTLLHEVTGNVYVPDLDDNITLDDVYGAYNRLKPGRATGDAWVKNMITSFHVFFMTFFNDNREHNFCKSLIPDSMEVKDNKCTL